MRFAASQQGTLDYEIYAQEILNFKDESLSCLKHIEACLAM
jgi:hypothetical protein